MGRYSLNGQVALVTGAARGIGAATARSLHARGAKVALVDLDPPAAFDPQRTLGLAADVTDREAIKNAVEATIERFGGLDVIVANAGIAPKVTTALTMDPDVFERVVEVDLLGVWRTVHAGLPHVAKRQGHVVLVASVYAFANGVGATPYAVAKAGVEQLGRALRVELAQHGASASVAYFGFIDTHMVHETIDADPLADRMLATYPKQLHKRLPPEAAGEAIARGIERRAARIVRPRRWAALSTLRGIVNPLIDERLRRDATVQQLLREVESRSAQQVGER
ncbi:short-chain dehydrogenase/reductase [Solirubrobacter soli]|uniref:short-chain dehydrogenase/reductase n=1 Tax=Solirubrobacter soli TaxID=363832 RepID=UPI00040BC853|nr:short-chain dehydrogenase/reductase [Solirubrobacter soli]